jgi:hypothetical protein
LTYWIAALLLVAFGFVTGFSIGPPFLLVGLVLLALGRLRRWPRLFWPPLVGVVALIIGVVVFAPLTCTATEDAGSLSQTVCTSILGPTWSGSGLYNPPPDAFALAFRVGLGAGVVDAIMTFVWLTILRQRPRGAGREDGHQGSSSL